MLFYEPRWRAIDADGHAIAGAKLHCYQAGTSSTSKDTFYNVDCAIGHENSNPVIADSGGLFGPIYLSGSYKFELTDADDIPIWSQDDAGNLSASDITYLDRTVEEKLSDIVSIMDYGAVGDGVIDDAPAFIVALADLAVAGGVLHVPAKTFAIGSTLQWPTNVGCNADADSLLLGINSCAGCIVMLGTFHNGPMILPRIRNFSSYGLKLAGTCNLDVFVQSITNCGNCLWIDTVNATHPNLLDTTVRFNHMGGLPSSVRGIYITADNNANLIQGLEIRGNFITEVTTCVEFSGSAVDYPGWDSNVIVIQATDTVFAANSRVFKTNQNVINCTLKVEAWCGGLPAASTSKFLEGPFQVCDISLALAQNPVAGQFALTGSVQNQVNLRRPQHSGQAAYTPVTTPDSLASFNSGVPLWMNWNHFLHTLAGDLTNGSTLDLYIYHQLPGCDGDIHIMVLPTGTGAMVAPCISVQNRHATFANEIKLIFKNTTGSTITTGTGLYFAVRCGLW